MRAGETRRCGWHGRRRDRSGRRPGSSGEGNPWSGVRYRRGGPNAPHRPGTRTSRTSTGPTTAWRRAVPAAEACPASPDPPEAPRAPPAADRPEPPPPTAIRCPLSAVRQNSHTRTRPRRRAPPAAGPGPPRPGSSATARARTRTCARVTAAHRHRAQGVRNPLPRRHGRRPPGPGKVTLRPRGTSSAITAATWSRALPDVEHDTRQHPNGVAVFGTSGPARTSGRSWTNSPARTDGPARDFRPGCPGRPQAPAFFTRALMTFSSAAVSSFRA